MDPGKSTFKALKGIVAFCVACCGAAAYAGRFGFEYNEAEPWDQAKHDTLLSRLGRITQSGDINVNALAGGWMGMQPAPDDPVDFSVTDAVVKVFGRYGFSLTWNLYPNAAWAFPNKQACRPDTVLGIPVYAKHCAPESSYESHWTDYIKSIVERYDGDGSEDMPGLEIPIRYYVMTGEIKFGKTGKGDEENGPFWYDSIDHLLRLHRITYQAIREADPSGNSKLISSGAVLFDLFADFPDYPDFEPAAGSTNQQRLGGQNYRGSLYTAGWDSLEKMLDSFGNDSDGVECDWIGWHPHFSWRVMDQEFALIRAHAGAKHVFVDDMWSNLFPMGYAGVPGEAQFNASKWPGRDWVREINGDFPNALFSTQDPYGELFQKLNGGDPDVLAWYNAKGAMQLVKSAASAFGEGANHVSFSGTNDLLLLGVIRGWELGWINLTGTPAENYPEKPQYHTYRLLAEKLEDFTGVEELPVGSDPRTRLYRFDRPRGPVWIGWSETGDAPPGLDYRVQTGENISFDSGADLLRTRPVTSPSETEPETDTLATRSGRADMQLGYEPVFLERISGTSIRGVEAREPEIFDLGQNYPNPANPATSIPYSVFKPCSLKMTVYSLKGRLIQILKHDIVQPGPHQIRWDASAFPAGIYFCRLEADGMMDTVKMIVIK